MKNLILFLGFIALLTSCKNDNSDTQAKTVSTAQKIDYPDALDKIFEHHGTLDLWKKMKTMSYEMVKDGGNEKQTIDLISRREVITGSNFTSGYDGKEYWVEADTTYKGNAKFYTNLIFYFYAMPFVLVDDGITYTKVEAISFEGIDYPGYRISYSDGIGVSPKDEYFIHYDPVTYEMAWLGYTVTYHSGKASDKISWIRYNDWKQISGLKLTNSLTWFKSEDGKLVEPRNTRNFVNILVNEKESDASIFAKTAGAKIVE